MDIVGERAFETRAVSTFPANVPAVHAGTSVTVGRLGCDLKQSLTPARRYRLRLGPIHKTSIDRLEPVANRMNRFAGSDSLHCAGSDAKPGSTFAATRSRGPIK
jgi:hypothetical protein